MDSDIGRGHSVFSSLQENTERELSQTDEGNAGEDMSVIVLVGGRSGVM